MNQDKSPVNSTSTNKESNNPQLMLLRTQPWPKISMTKQYSVFLMYKELAKFWRSFRNQQNFWRNIQAERRKTLKCKRKVMLNQKSIPVFTIQGPLIIKSSLKATKNSFSDLHSQETQNRLTILKIYC